MTRRTKEQGAADFGRQFEALAQIDYGKAIDALIAQIRPHNSAVDEVGFRDQIVSLSETIGEVPRPSEVEQAAIWYARGFAYAREVSG